MATSYATPGIYIEERPSGSMPIQGVGTAIAAFVGLTDTYNPAEGDPDDSAGVQPQLVTSWPQYERIYGGCDSGALLPYAVRGFFDNVPESLEEAAMVDGLSRFAALWRVIVPVMGPGIIATFIFNFVNCWNELFLSVTLINTDDAPRDVDMRVHLPDGVTLERVDITQQDAGKTEPNAQDLTLHFTVPSYIQTKKVTVVSLTLRVSPFYAGRTVNPMVELLQPNSNLSWVSLPLDVPGGATAITGVTRLFLPHISVGMSRPTPSTPNVNP